MKKNLLSMFFATALLVGGTGMLSSCNVGENSSTTEESSSVYKEICKVTFDLMYSNKTREVEVKNGNKVTSYNPKRSGYTLMGWYYENTFKTKYDFNSAVTDDLTLYANWLENAKVVKYDVTFDLNYGNLADVTVKVIEGEKINSTDVPSPDRLGYELVGWYTTEDCQEGTEFDLEYDVVTGPLTLYAKYVRSPRLDLDDDGNLAFSNVSFNFAINESFGISNSVKTVVNKFNTENTGKIRVNVVDQSTTSNDLITLKLHQTEVVNYSGDYYDMEDVLDLAGIEFDATKYYADQIADNYKDGKLKTMPIGSYVPFVAYNKALMTKYNGSDPIPTTGTEWKALLQEVQTGEAQAQANAWNKALTISTEWEMKEISSHAIYIQNDSPFYVKNAEGKLVNTWLDSNDTKAAAANSFKTLREYISADSTFGKTYDAWGAAQPLVGDGTAFASVLGVPTLYNALGKNISKQDANLSSTVGVAPLSNFFASNPESEYADKVLVKGFGLGVTNSGPDDLMKIAAAGIFADYLSKNADVLVDNYVYPADKDAQDKLFAPTGSYALNWKAKLLEQCGDPENFMTYPGHNSEYTIFNYYNESLLPNLLMADVTDEVINVYVESMSAQITGALA